MGITWSTTKHFVNLTLRNKELEHRILELNQKIEDLLQENKRLEDETSKYQSKLGVATNIKPNDEGIVKDILSLQDKIVDYVTGLKKSKVDVKIDKIVNLLPLYNCQIKIDSNDPDKEIIRAILQRHVLEMIFGFAKDYFYTGKDYLESDIVRKTDELYNLMKTFVDTRDGTDEITKVTPIKLRQLVYTVLGIRGLGKIIESGGSYTHESIVSFTEKLNNSMNQYRVIKDPEMKKRVDESAEIIIQEVFRIFYFRLKVQEPVAQYHWFKRGDKVSRTTMKKSWDDDEIDDFVVELCTFPLIGVGQFTNSNQFNLSNMKVFTHAKVFIKKLQ